MKFLSGKKSSKKIFVAKKKTLLKRNFEKKISSKKIHQKKKLSRENFYWKEKFCQKKIVMDFVVNFVLDKSMLFFFWYLQQNSDVV